MADDLDHVTGTWNSFILPTAMTSDYQEFGDNYTDGNATILLSTESPSVSPSVFRIAESILARYLLPLVVAAGTFGNVTSLAVLLRRRMRRTSVYMYLSALAFADLSVLYLSAFKTWIRLMTDFELLHVSVASCKILSFVMSISQNMSAWLVVLTTIDRFVAVWLPLRAVAVCRHRRACIAIIVLFIVVSLFSLDIFWTVDLRHEAGSRSPRCLRLAGKWLVPIETLKLMSYSIVPFVVILLFNCAIVMRLRVGRTSVLRGGSHRPDNNDPTAANTSNRLNKHPHQQHHHHHTDHHQSSSTMIPLYAVGGTHSRRGGPRSAASSHSTASPSSAAATLHTKVTYMLLAVSITWLALTAPWTLRVFFMPNGDDPRGVKQLVTVICFLLMYTNHAINFYLYCITGRKFRRELVDMMSGMCVNRHERREDNSRGLAGKVCHSRRCCCCSCCFWWWWWGRRAVDRSSTELRSEMRIYSGIASSRVVNNNAATAVCRPRDSDVTHRQHFELEGVHMDADTAV